jgi:ABC-2 type transport system permease protein
MTAGAARLGRSGAGSPSLGPRRFGRVNWIGTAALYRRETWRLQKDYLDSLLGPALANLIFMLILTVAAGGGTARGSGTMVAGLPLTDFIAPGLIMFAAGERAFSAACVSILFDKLEGMIGDVVMAPLTSGERLAAFASASMTAGAISGAATAAVLWPFAHILPAHPTAFLYFLIAGSLLLGFIGTVAGLWARRWDHYAALLAYFLVPFSYLSGMFYSTLGLPHLARQLIALNPLYYVIDGMRYGMTGYAETDIVPGALLILVLDLALAGLVYGLLRSGWRLKA